VAAENVMSEPLFTLPVIGDFYLTNALIATLFMDIVIILVALAVRNSWKKNPLAPKGIGGIFEMLVEMIYNMTETTAGKYTPKIFPWFASILIVLLFANLMKLIPGFESIGILHHADTGYEIQSLGNGTWSTLRKWRLQLDSVPARGLHRFEFHHGAGIDCCLHDPGDWCPGEWGALFRKIY